MWTCALLKTNAKQALQGRYWVCLAACILAGILGGSGASLIDIQSNITVLLQSPQQLTEHSLDSLEYLVSRLAQSGYLNLIALPVLVGMLVSWAFRIFVAGPATCGMKRYMMESRLAQAPLGTLFSVFRTPYLNVVKVMLLRSLLIFVGYLLFLVPGIIWSYRYRLVPYLLAENPYLTTGRALELSRQMMHGEKLHSFVLELSFLGWMVLAALTLGIGNLFLQPYMEATFAEFYAAMRSKALSYGFSDESELGGFVRHSADN